MSTRGADLPADIMLEKYKADRAHELELNRIQAALEATALFGLVLLNGGAIVACLTLFAHVWGDGRRPAMGWISGGVLTWCLGIILGAITAFAGLRSQSAFTQAYRARRQAEEWRRLTAAGLPDPTIREHLGLENTDNETRLNENARIKRKDGGFWATVARRTAFGGLLAFVAGGVLALAAFQTRNQDFPAPLLENLKGEPTIPDWISGASGAVAAAVAVVALLYAVSQVKLAHQQRQDQLEAQQHVRDYTFGQFLLQLDEAFLEHKKVHRRLRPRHLPASNGSSEVGSWTNGGGPESVEDWADVEAYLGLFERVAILTERGLLEPEVVNRLYGYRVANIWANDIIRDQKLVKLADGWEDFLNLTRILEEQGARFKGRSSSSGITSSSS